MGAYGMQTTAEFSTVSITDKVVDTTPSSLSLLCIAILQGSKGGSLPIELNMSTFTGDDILTLRRERLVAPLPMV